MQLEGRDTYHVAFPYSAYILLVVFYPFPRVRQDVKVSLLPAAVGGNEEPVVQGLLLL